MANGEITVLWYNVVQDNGGTTAYSMIQQATGESLNTQWFRRYLEQRYTKAL